MDNDPTCRSFGETLFVYRITEGSVLVVALMVNDLGECVCRWVREYLSYEKKEYIRIIFGVKLRTLFCASLMHAISSNIVFKHLRT